MKAEPSPAPVRSLDFACLVMVGAGKMGGAMLEGWLALGLDGHKITVLDPRPSDALLSLASIHGIAVNPSAPAGEPADVLVLAVKPQMLDAALATISTRTGPGTLLLSVIAGKTVRDLATRLPEAGTIVRAMPNTPAAVGRGITGVVAGTPLSPRQREIVDALLRAVGQVEWLADEALIDAVTAVSGSGPAYVFYMTECLAKAAEAAGLDPDLAARLARATVEGAAELMYRSASLTPAVLRQNVTSPAGTTAAGLAVLSGSPGLPSLMERAVAAAKQRAHELAG